MKQILHVLYQPYQWLVLVPAFVVVTLVCAILNLVLLAVAGPRTAGRIAAGSWARWTSYLTPIFVKVIGREHIDPRQSYVIVSNHQSIYDIFVLYGWLGIDFKWVMKHEIRKIPVVGHSCDKLGHVFIDRSNHAAAINSINAARDRIVGGTSILFFPEGTRSRDGRLGHFKKGAFRLALDLELPILPLTITGTRAIMPTKTMRIFPGRATLIIHQPVPRADLDPADLNASLARVRAIIASGLDRPPQSGRRATS